MHLLAESNVDMRSRSTSHAAVGSVTAVLGLAALVATIVRPEWSFAPFLGTPAWVLLATAGAVLLLAGGCVLGFSFRPPPEEADFVRAHVAFNSRMSVPSAVLSAAPTPMPRPIAALSPPPAPAARAQPARLPAPTPSPSQRVPPIKADVRDLDAQIRELTKNISKAGVMLATGQLSQEGYLAYVDDLKAKRAKLEAQRVRAELSS